MNCSKKSVWIQMRVLYLKQWGHCGVGVEVSVNESGQPIPKGPIDKFVISQPRQNILSSKWKLKERKCVKKFVSLCTQKVSHLIQ